MNLPVVQESGAGPTLGAASLEFIRAKMRRIVTDNPHLTNHEKGRIYDELDLLIENERQRQVQLAAHQRNLLELEHRILLAQKQAEAVSSLRLLKARTDKEVARCVQESLAGRLNIIERVLQLKAKYKPVVKQDDHQKELLQIRKQQQLSEAKEQAMLQSITRRAENRATFIKTVNEKFPDMADELTDFYDQQIFQQGTRR